MRALKHNKKGQTGLNVLAFIVISLFSIGFILAVFAIMTSEIAEETWDAASGTQTNETALGVLNETFINLNTTLASYYQPVCTLTEAQNDSATANEMELANFTTSNCQVRFSGSDDDLNNTAYNFSYTWTANVNSTESIIAQDVGSELGEVTDWYGIIIVLGAMVVLIMLTVIIIMTLKGSGIIALEGKAPKETA